MVFTFGFATGNATEFHRLDLFCPLKLMEIYAFAPFTSLMSTVSAPPLILSVNSPRLIELG
jgi:hypothetical protein